MIRLWDNHGTVDAEINAQKGRYLKIYITVLSYPIYTKNNATAAI
jgi:hypothetical protein